MRMEMGMREIVKMEQTCSVLEWVSNCVSGDSGFMGLTTFAPFRLCKSQTESIHCDSDDGNGDGDKKIPINFLQLSH